MLAVGVSADGYQPASLAVEVEDVPFLWRNPVSHTDVNNDGLLTPADVLVLLNDINLNDIRLLPLTGTFVSPPFLDVNGDGRVTPNDVVIVINAINSQVEGEGSAHLIDDSNGRFDFLATTWQSSSQQVDTTPRRLAVTVERDFATPVEAHRNRAMQRSRLQLRRMPTQHDSETDNLEPLLELLAADVASQQDVSE
jgi:hypothetical protein